MTELDGRVVFLSASFPSGQRGERFAPSDPSAIADAVTAVVRAVLLSGGQLLFGGHPTITPLVLMIGNELNVHNAVDVFQSRWFEDQITPETRRLAELGFGQIHWTDKLEDLDDSLRLMRESMFLNARPSGAIFIGGMEGILREYDNLGTLFPSVPRIPLNGPGGAAARLRPAGDGLPQDLLESVGSRHYPYVASLIVESLASQEKMS